MTQLYACVPSSWLWMPKWARLTLGWISVTIFSMTFLSGPITLLLFLPQAWSFAPSLSKLFSASVVISYLLPLKEWPYFRRVGQLWYEIFQVSTNLSIDEVKERIQSAQVSTGITNIHPHGIIPIHGIILGAYFDQYFGQDCYGFAAAADVVFYVPFLRNILVRRRLS